MVVVLIGIEADGDGEMGPVGMDAELVKWLESESVASYRGWAPTRTVDVPVLLNIVFVGFDGDGSYGLKLSQDDLEKWFEHIEHSLPHTSVPVGVGEDEPDDEEIARTADESVNPEGIAAAVPWATHGGSVKPKRPSVVEYKYSFNVVKLDPMVNEYFEGLLSRNLRPDVPPPASVNDQGPLTAHYQVDAWDMSQAIHSLTEGLNVTRSYTLFIMNPKAADGVNHNYVYGYRRGFSDRELSELRAAPALTDDERDGFEEDVEDVNNDFEDEEDDDYDGLYYTPKSPWETPHARLEPLKDYYNELLEVSRHWADKSLDALETVQPKEIPYIRGEKTFMDLADEIMHAETRYPERDYLWLAQNEPWMKEDCLVDNWVGDGRWAMIDLSAGPFSWGPIVGGEGVRSSHSLPRVAELLEAHPEFEIPDHPTHHQEGDTNDENELAVLRAFHDRWCGAGDREHNEKFCADLEDRVNKYHMNKKYSPGSTGADPEEALHQAGFLSGGDEEGSEADGPLSVFLARLGSVLSNTLTHLVTPSSAGWRTPYRPRIAFHIYMVTNHDTYDPLHPDNFNLNTFRNQLESFRAPGGTFAFQTHHMSLIDDKALALAYEKSLRSATVPTLTADGTFIAARRLYIDSEMLKSELDALTPVHDRGDPGSEFDEDNHRTGHRDIPVFVFSLDYPLPVFVDKWHLARGLKDMVIVVQNNVVDWPSHLGCNGKAVHWNLRAPMGPALAASAQTLAGLTVPQMSWDSRTERVNEDWLWSVGDAPGVLTNSRSDFNTFQRDSVLRNWLVGALDDGIGMLNDGIEALQRRKTTRENFAVNKGQEIGDLGKVYARANRHVKALTKALEDLHFKDAFERARGLLQEARKFRRAAMALARGLDVHDCDQAQIARPGSAPGTVVIQSRTDENADAGAPPAPPPGSASTDWLTPVLLVGNVVVLWGACSLRGRFKGPSKVKIN